MSLNALDFTVCYDLTKVHSNSADCLSTKMLLLSRIKNGMTPQRLLCTLKGSASGGARGLPRDCLVSIISQEKIIRRIPTKIPNLEE